MKRSTNLAIAVSATTILALSGCGEGVDHDAAEPQTSVDASSPSATNAALDRDRLEHTENNTITLPVGWFEMAGYGTILHVDENTITPHYVTPSTCVAGDSFDNQLVVDHVADDGVITLDLVGPTTDYRLLPLNGEPQCDSDSGDTLIALEEVFATHYPFFEQRNVDWPTEVGGIRAAVANDSEHFLDALRTFIVRLGDGHTTLDDLAIDPDIEDFGLDHVTTLDELETAIGAELDRTLASIDDLEVDRTMSVAWGRLDADTGYLVMMAFEGISGDDDPVADRDALRAALDKAVTDLADTDRLVVDMRFNGGGYEDLAILAAGYFVDEPTPGYSKWAHAQPDAFVQTVEVVPQHVTYQGSVAVVTSPITASAAEAFTLAIVQVADAAVVGNPSFGEFSDAIDWMLPDGTEFTLSMENYTDLSGANHEATGIPVDVSAPLDEAIATAADHLARVSTTN